MNALRLTLGTLTILPVRPPTTVDRRTAGRAMVLAPLVGLLLGLIVLAVLAVLAALTTSASLGTGVDSSGFVLEGDRPLPVIGAGPPTLVLAALLVGLLALLTRGMHLDGLADTVDGLGVGPDRERALAVMRKGDVGPFGVVALVMVLLVQVACVQRLGQAPDGVLALLACLVVSRLPLPLLCSAGIPAARPEGLGATVAGSVSRPALAVTVLLAAAGVAVAAFLEVALAVPQDVGSSLGRAGVLVAVPLVVAGALAWRCVRRFGGITGDVLGACVEVAFTVALLVAAL